MSDTIPNNSARVKEESFLQFLAQSQFLKAIANVLILTATQNIAQRGHRESLDSKYIGNFLPILYAKHEQLIQKRTDAYGNSKYTSHQI